MENGSVEELDSVTLNNKAIVRAIDTPDFSFKGPGSVVHVTPSLDKYLVGKSG